MPMRNSFTSCANVAVAVMSRKLMRIAAVAVVTGLAHMLPLYADPFRRQGEDGDVDERTRARQ
ncbi:MAG: hypothetical protein DHS20C03_07940 [Minwuia thermotolerans]|nr:MAG: hypothetical protein DHS20C03_07940 [Minwuia thermotolerans]